MILLIKDLIADESGATAVEYGLIAAVVSTAIIVSLQSLGTSLNTIFFTLSKAID